MPRPADFPPAERPWRIVQGDCREILGTLPAESVQTCVTSPPYWGLRDYGVEGQLGLERTPEEYVAKMVEAFRGVWRVLRPDGTLWLNLGDCYCSAAPGNERPDHSGGRMLGSRGRQKEARSRGERRPASNGRGEPQARTRAERDPRHAGKHTAIVAGGPMVQPNRRALPGLKPKDLIGIPWRVAFALQADGWWLRSDIVWSKPNPMPESVEDRPTKAHEYLFLLAKSERYFYDAHAVREEHATPPERRATKHGKAALRGQEAIRPRGNMEAVDDPAARYYAAGGRNARSVWTIATRPFPEAHFAVMPPELARRCVLAGSSEHGACPMCGSPWEREIERSTMIVREGPGRQGLKDSSTTGTQRTACSGTMLSPPSARTVGWRPTCRCEEGGASPMPCSVLDPFAGAGTVGMVARRLGRSFVGIELSPAYIALAERRIVDDAPLLNGGRLA